MTIGVRSGAKKMENGELGQQSAPKVGKWISVRFALSYLSCLGAVVIYMQRANLSIAIISMVNASALGQDSGANVTRLVTSKPSTAGEFNWSTSQVGLVLSAFFYGYIVTQFPGGYLSTKFGGKLVFGGGVLVTSVMTLLTPLAARTSIYCLVAVRLLEGLAQGVVFPAIQAIFGIWAPPLERSLLVSIALSGAYLGGAASQIFSGILSDFSHQHGWQSVFYAFGGIGVLWSVVWFLFASDAPAKHPTISQAELEYIQNNVPQQTRKTPSSAPWCAIISSKPVWAVVIAQFMGIWGVSLLITSLPLYLTEVLHFNIIANGFLSSIPFLTGLILMNLGGYAANKVQERGLVSVNGARKTWVSVGGFGACAFFLATGFIRCNRAAAVALIVIASGLLGFSLSASMTNVVDIAPRYAGFLMGITNTMNSIPGLVIPLIVGALTEKAATHAQWMYVFVLSSAISGVGGLVFLIFGSGEEQPWNKYHDNNDEEESTALLK